MENTDHVPNNPKNARIHPLNSIEHEGNSKLLFVLKSTFDS
jgi:hypothetical protein